MTEFRMSHTPAWWDILLFYQPLIQTWERQKNSAPSTQGHRLLIISNTSSIEQLLHNSSLQSVSQRTHFCGEHTATVCSCHPASLLGSHIAMKGSLMSGNAALMPVGHTKSLHLLVMEEPCHSQRPELGFAHVGFPAHSRPQRVM